MGRVPHALCLSTEAFMWVRFHEMRGRESVLASTVAEDWSGSAWPLSQNRAWMLNSIPSADAEQMMEQIKEVPACPQPESTGEARQGRPGAGRPEGGGPTGEARGGEAWLGGSLAWGGLGGGHGQRGQRHCPQPPPAFPRPHHPALVARPGGRLGVWNSPTDSQTSIFGSRERCLHPHFSSASW